MLSILLIEDNDLNRRFMTELLHVHNYEVYEALSEEHALEILRSLPIDLVISDFLLGEDTVEDTLRDIRKSFPNKPIWLVSGVAQDKTHEICGQLNLIYIEKPIELDPFLELLKEAEEKCQRAS